MIGKGKMDKERTKIIKINNKKITVVIPPKMSFKDVPKEIRSKKNHPKGLVIAL